MDFSGSTQLLPAIWLPKLPQFQKLQLETQNQVQRKLLLWKRIKNMSIRKLQSKEHQRCQNQRKWMKFHPHRKRKQSGYCSFMARDGPRTLGLKEIPQVGFKDQDLIVNSPLYLLHIFLKTNNENLLLDHYNNYMYLISFSVLITCLWDNVWIFLGEVTC